MKLKLQFASLLTLGILSGFVVAVVLAAAYAGGFVSAPLVIIITITFNIIMWLVGPYISDIIYKWFYKIEFYDYEQIKDKPFMDFVKKVCDEHKIKVPRIGIIKDKNPTAFTYGSASFNARIVLTEGLFEFLNQKELEAVVAHELGHIINMDFIIMTIAATLLEVLYELYVILARARGASAGLNLRKKAKKDGGGLLILIGYASLVLHYVGTYLLLYLSRTREYYADEFSAKKTGDPNLLSSALIKVAYGIASVPDTAKTAHLLNNTRAQGIFDFKTASEVGLVYLNSKDHKDRLEKSLLFDIVNPWAWVMQLKSTHPLVGKRIKRLCSMTSSPAFSFEEISRKQVDKGRLWKNFFTDILVGYSTGATIAAFIAIIGAELFYKSYFSILPTLGIFFLLLVIFSVIKITYKFPKKAFPGATVIDCMSDLYASPVKGRPVMLEGKAIGRGQAGYIFGEDMIFRDSTGIVYLNYESAIPFFGNIFFAWKRLESLLQKPAKAAGWFFRGATHHIELYRFKSGSQEIKSYVRFWTVVGLVINVIFFGFIITLLGIYIYTKVTGVFI